MPGELQKRKGKSSTLQLELPSSSLNNAPRPAVSALFLVTFDPKAGYTISWKRSTPGLELSDSVEFKSLPSGLHNVGEDLVYFVHEDKYAGISAFVNKATDKQERGALMLAVGALIPLEYGRLGRSWRHADGLKELARQLVVDAKRTDLLESYWEEFQSGKEAAKLDDTVADPAEGNDDDSKGPALAESLQSQAKSLLPGPSHELSLFHPARSTPAMLETFGPLIYPIYKAALLRKRILLVTEAPVELSCNFVYNVSIISNIPSSLANIVPLDPLPVRLQPLFAIGVHDIDALKTRAKDASKKGEATQLSEGWVACTTDDVLAHKKDIFDIAVTIPTVPADKDASRTWPKIKTSDGGDLKANQRDVRRYRNLRRAMDRRDAASTKSSMVNRGDQSTDEDETSASDDDTPLLQRSRSRQSLRISAATSEVEIHESLVEPETWTAVAYNSFIWWASAGEKGAELDEETTHDQSMFQAYEPYSDTPTPGRPASLRSATTGLLMTDGNSSAPEMAVIAYFHRLTTSILQVLANLVDDSEEDEEQERRERLGGARPRVVVEGEDLTRMGLDPWSESDRVFVAQLLDFYWGRKADVRGGRIECCGIRIG